MKQTDIGEKIKRLRLQRNMTQSDLAGDQITRNMLSRVENGAALPSLPTVWYLAERLGVPAGFLLAEGDDDRIWRKMNRIDSIRRVLRGGDPRICLELCREDGDQVDDEICLIMAQCSLEIAKEEFHRGCLRSACKALDEAIEYAGRTLYDTAAIRQTAAVYFRFMHRLSATLYSDALVDAEDAFPSSADPFARYALAREAMEAEEMRRVESYLKETFADDGWHAHLGAELVMRREDFASARTALLHLLHSDACRSEVLMYAIFCDLEICCRETEDFRGAYEYSQNKVAQLEKMLRE